jgi:hypothetical protein
MLALKTNKNGVMEFKEICNFNFVKVGEAYFCDEPLKKDNGKPVIFGGKELVDWKLKLKLVVNKKILDAGQSVYLVFKNNDILYVGYYSNSFRQRWWKKQGYFWHGDILDNKVNELVKKGDDISVWLSVDPYEGKFNISKLIEDEVIIQYMDNGILLNKIGKNLKKDRESTLTVQEILEIN